MKAVGLMLLSFLALAACGAPVIHLVGDSTMCNYAPNTVEQTGWGQMLSGLTRDGVKVSNRAVSGESMRHFRSSGRWQKVLDEAKEGDLLVLQFGINDAEKRNEKKFLCPESFCEELVRAVREAKEKKISVILATTIPAYSFNKRNEFVLSRREYNQALREAAGICQIPCVDLYQLGARRMMDVGAQKSAEYFILDKRNPNAIDGCHTTKAGAQVMAEAFVYGVKKANLPEKSFFR
ncbi:MAG: GDSL-type esterase/lipase family protein [Victivallaceae bacterium]|nr:GDSL-type esterase/lipase family protein [Victivallaceae bacterium]